MDLKQKTCSPFFTFAISPPIILVIGLTPHLHVSLSELSEAELSDGLVVDGGGFGFIVLVTV